MQQESVAAPTAHAGHSAEEVRKHVKVYMGVFAVLIVLTVITVAASKLQLSIVGTIAVALAIASVKGALVAGFFMHLISERAVIYWVLVICAVFFLALLLLPVFTDVEMVRVVPT